MKYFLLSKIVTLLRIVTVYGYSGSDSASRWHYCHLFLALAPACALRRSLCRFFRSFWSFGFGALVLLARYNCGLARVVACFPVGCFTASLPMLPVSFMYIIHVHMYPCLNIKCSSVCMRYEHVVTCSLYSDKLITFCAIRSS